MDDGAIDAGTPEPLAIPYERCGAGSCLAVANLAPDLRAKAALELAVDVGDPLYSDGVSGNARISASRPTGTRPFCQA